MKTININLIGDRPATRLSLTPDLDIDPSLIVTAGAGLLGAFLLPMLIGVAIDTFLTNPANQEIDRLKSSIGANRGKATQLAQIQKQAQALEGDYGVLLSLAKQSATWKSVLEEVRDVTPTDMWLTGLSIAKGGPRGSRLKLQGKALDYRAIAFFYTNLQNATNFGHPVLGGLQTEMQGGQSVIVFTVDCDIQSVGG